MTVATASTTLGLAPLQAALVARSRAQADALVDAAQAEGEAALGDAQAHVHALLSEARRQGEADGADVLAAERAAARRAARTALLAAQRAVYDDLVRQARHTVIEVLDRPGSRERLEAGLRRRLGGVADVTETPDGGLLARTADGRTIDASVAALADSAVGGLDLEDLWSTG
jgi:hypothetical protein